MTRLRSGTIATLLALACLGLGGIAEARPKHPPHAHGHKHLTAAHGRLGARDNAATHIQRGMASVYAEKFRGRRMADGTRFDPLSNAAASKTLPLGSTAHVR